MSLPSITSNRVPHDAGRRVSLAASAIAAGAAARRGAAKPVDRSQHPRGDAAGGDCPIYEAGGGSTSFLPLNVLRAPMSPSSISTRTRSATIVYAQEAILGDIQTHRFPPDSFDLVICYNVIEHVPDVEAALLGFCNVAEAERVDPDRRTESKVAVRCRHQIFAALVPCLVLPTRARRQEGRPAGLRRRSRPISIGWSRLPTSRPSPGSMACR